MVWQDGKHESWFESWFGGGVVTVLMDGRRSDEVVGSMGGWMIGEAVG